MKTKTKPAWKEIKVRPATLQSLGFEAGEHVHKLKGPMLKRIGKFLHKHELLSEPAEWWYSDEKYRFRCDGREYSIHAEAFDVMNNAWLVRFTRGLSDQEKVAADRIAKNEAALAAHSKDTGIPVEDLRQMCLAAGIEQFATEGITDAGGRGIRRADALSLRGFLP